MTFWPILYFYVQEDWISETMASLNSDLLVGRSLLSFFCVCLFFMLTDVFDVMLCCCLHVNNLNVVFRIVK